MGGKSYSVLLGAVIIALVYTPWQSLCLPIQSSSSNTVNVLLGATLSNYKNTPRPVLLLLLLLRDAQGAPLFSNIQLLEYPIPLSSSVTKKPGPTSSLCRGANFEPAKF